MAAGALFLHERLTLTVGAAFALILAGSVLATAGGPKPVVEAPVKVKAFT